MPNLIPILAPVLLTAGLGYLWARSGRAFETEFVTRIATYVGVPALAFSALTEVRLSADVLLRTVGLALAAVVLFALVGAAALKLLRQPVRPMLPSLVLPNTGNMGLPIVFFAFGDEGLALAIAFTVVIMMLHHTLGAALASGRTHPATIARQPVIYALVAALGFVLTGTPVPPFLANWTALLGGLTIPLMLLALGVSLAKLTVADLPGSAALGVVRVGAGFVVGLGLATAIDLPPLAAGVLIIQCSMPTAVFSYLYAARYGGPAVQVAGVVVLSTLISFVSLPLILPFVLSLAG